MTAIKPFRLLVLLLVVALLWSGVRESSVVSRLRTEHEALASRASIIGLSEKEGDGERSASRASGRPSETKIPAERLKDEILEAYHRLKALGDSEDPENRLKVEAEVREWIGRLIDLSPKELKRMISDLTSDPSLDPKEVRDLVSVALNLAASRQGEVAAELALAHREQGGSVSGVIGAWAQQDPSNAFAWLEKNKQQLGEGYLSIFQQAITQSAARDPGLALAALQRIGPDRKRGETARELANRLPDEPSRSALVEAMIQQDKQGMEGLMDEPELLIGLGKSMVEHSGNTNADWLKSLSPDQAMRLASGIGQSAKALDRPDTWLDWMGKSLPPEKLGDTAKPLLRNWISDDYEAAGEWINRQPAGEFRNEAAANYARMMAKRFPDTAKDWANTLPEGPDKQRLLEQLK